MITLTAQQAAIVDSDVKTDISWLFEIDRTGNGSIDDYWSTKEKTYNAQTYTFKILSFSDINLQRNKSEFGMQSPGKFDFTITNGNTTLSPSDFVGGNVTVKLVVKSLVRKVTVTVTGGTIPAAGATMTGATSGKTAILVSSPDAWTGAVACYFVSQSGAFQSENVSFTGGGTGTISADLTYAEEETLIASWSYAFVSAIPTYQNLKINCKDWITVYLDGTYPNTSTVSSVFTTFSGIDDTWCLPECYGVDICTEFPVIHVSEYKATKSFWIGNEAVSPNVVTFVAATKKISASSFNKWAEYCVAGDKVIISGAPTLVNSGTFTIVTSDSTGITVSEVILNETYNDGYGIGFTFLDNTKYDNDISFTSATSTISKVSGGLSSFVAGQVVIVTGSASNNKAFLIDTVSDTALTVSGNTVTDEAAGNNIYLAPAITKVLLSKQLDSGSYPDYSFPVKAFAPVGFFTSTGNRTAWTTSNCDLEYSRATLNGTDYYETFRIIGTDSNGDSVYDSPNWYYDKGKYSPIPVQENRKYSVAGSYTAYTPSKTVEKILLGFGIPSAKLDATSLATVASAHVTYGLSWGLPLTRFYDRKTLLSWLLTIGNMELVIRDKVYFKVHSKTSKKTITSSLILKNSFTSTALTVEESDSGHIATAISQFEGVRPEDEVKEYLVTAKGASDHVSGDVLNCLPVRGASNSDSIGHCIRLGTLHFQRKYLPLNEKSMKLKGKCLMLEPDDVVTIAGDNYGATTGAEYDILINSINISRSLEITVVGTQYSQSLDDWADITPTVSNYVPSPQESGNTYSVVVSGPDAAGQTGQQIPNLLRGALRIGATGNYLHLDPVEPLLQMAEGGVVRVKIGDIGTGDYGFELLDHSGVSIMKLNGSGTNVLSGWALSADSLTKTNGGNTVILSTGATAITAGPTGSPTFTVTQAGLLTATGAIISGMITGSYVYGSSLMTKGTYLASTCAAADATLNVGSTADFPASGTAWFIDSANDRDAFTYTGKTATTLTGCSGVLAHTVSATNKPLVVPAVKGIYVSDAANEIRFFGDRGDGTVEEIGGIGLAGGAGDIIIGKFGSANSSRIGVYGESSSKYGVYGVSASGDGVYGYSGSSHGVWGQSQTGMGVYATSISGPGVQASSYSNVALYGYSELSYSVYSAGTTYLGGNTTITTGSWLGLGTGKGRITFTDAATDDLSFSDCIATFPNEGIHILDTNASHDLIIKVGSDLSADRILTITTGDAARTLTIEADSLINQDLTTDANVTFAGATLNNTGLHILDTNASHDLIIAPGSNLTADRTLTVTTGDADRTLTMTGDASISGTNTGDHTESYIYIRDEKAQNTHGGTFTSGAWQTRTLNTEVNDAGGHASLASNQITLAAGTYRFRCVAPAIGVEAHQCRLANITDSVYFIGSSEYAHATYLNTNNSRVEGRFTIADAKVFELQHRCGATKTTNGFGNAANLGTEVYATVEFWKE